MITGIPITAIVDASFERGEVIFIFALVIATITVAVYTKKLRTQLQEQKRRLDEQAEFNKKLNATVDRILKIEESGSIDTNRGDKP